MTLVAGTLSAATPELTPSEGALIYANLQATIAAAGMTSAGGAVEFERVLAGHPARFRITGRRLAGVVASPFAHLPRPEPSSHRGPELTIELAEGGAAGLVDPEGRLDLCLPSARGDATVTSTDGRWVVYRRSATLTCLDRARGRIVGWAETADRLSLTDRGRPLDAPLFLWLRDHGVQTVHAGLVAANGRGILVAGGSGSGKTTTVLSCLLDAFDFVSDDYVGLEGRADSAYSGHGLHGSAYLHTKDLARFPRLAEHAVHGSLPADDKVLIPLSDTCPGRLRPTARIDLVLLPRVTGGSHPKLSPARKSQALLRLAPSSLWMVHHPRAAALHSLAALVESVPCYWLELGGETAAIAPALRALVREI